MADRVELNPMPKVLVTARSFRRLQGEHWQALREAGYEIATPSVDRPLGEEEMIPLIGEADAVIVGVDAVTERVIAAAPRLKVISKHGVGVDNIDVEAATRAGVVVTNTPGGNQVAVAELTVGLILALARKIPYHDALVKGGGWTRRTGIELAGKTIGFVGFGRIAKDVVVRLGEFSMEFLAYDIYEDRVFAEAHGVRFTTLPELLSRSDIVTLHAALTKGSRYLMGESEIACMKSGAYLINTARGDLVDENALYRALVENRLAGAAIDTLAQEPPKDSPLLQLGEKVILTPHIGAQSEEAILRVGLMAAQNVVQVLCGSRPVATINPQVYVAAAEVQA
jgi:D-3-phosphoglycerate dehydrogenase / 2-oxoglutarate reductase